VCHSSFSFRTQNGREHPDISKPPRWSRDSPQKKELPPPRANPRTKRRNRATYRSRLLGRGGASTPESSTAVIPASVILHVSGSVGGGGLTNRDGTLQEHYPPYHPHTVSCTRPHDRHGLRHRDGDPGARHRRAYRGGERWSGQP